MYRNVLHAKSYGMQHQIFRAEIIGHPLDVYKAVVTTQSGTRSPSLSKLKCQRLLLSSLLARHCRCWDMCQYRTVIKGLAISHSTLAPQEPHDGHIHR